jgi:CAAX prenyl protease-like protein
MPAELASSSSWIRFGWLAFRIAGAVVTVPIAEELAFRGYGLRRLVSPDFTAVDFRNASYMALAVSSVLFGVMHGRRWIAGTIAGLLYAIAAQRRRSMGDAVMAHAVTNALLALWVMYTGAWGMW